MDFEMEHILLVEDDETIIKNLLLFLEREGYKISVAKGQKTAQGLIDEMDFDLCLLDISLEDGNGFGVFSYIKEKKDIPVIFLTASGDEYSVVLGLDMGAHDYVSKPFRPRELLSRIRRALSLRHKEPVNLVLGDLEVDPKRGLVKKKGVEIFLSALEYRLLLVFFRNKGLVLSRNKLLEEIYDVAGEYVNDNTLTVYIKRLRDKIEVDPKEAKIIKTVRGIGYKMGE